MTRSWAARSVPASTSGFACRPTPGSRQRSSSRSKLEFTFFDFLSAIDWMPSPFGRYEDAEVDSPLADKLGQPYDLETGYAGGDTRFQMLARVFDFRDRHVGVTLKSDVPDETMTMESWVRVYAGADWHERETWEMYGINFEGHPGLRHIYLPTEFEGHPLRKDFPLLARVVKPWPGIVDVEPMPGEPEGEAEEDTEGDRRVTAFPGHAGRLCPLLRWRFVARIPVKVHK